MSDLFGDLPIAPRRPAEPAPRVKPLVTALVPGTPEYERCPCGAPAVYGFGVSPKNDRPGLRRCGPCARAEGRLDSSTSGHAS